MLIMIFIKWSNEIKMTLLPLINNIFLIFIMSFFLLRTFLFRNYVNFYAFISFIMLMFMI